MILDLEPNRSWVETDLTQPNPIDSEVGLDLFSIFYMFLLSFTKTSFFNKIKEKMRKKIPNLNLHQLINHIKHKIIFKSTKVMISTLK